MGIKDCFRGDGTDHKEKLELLKLKAAGAVVKMREVDEEYASAKQTYNELKEKRYIATVIEKQLSKLYMDALVHVLEQHKDLFPEDKEVQQVKLCDSEIEDFNDRIGGAMALYFFGDRNIEHMKYEDD